MNNKISTIAMSLMLSSMLFASSGNTHTKQEENKNKLDYLEKLFNGINEDAITEETSSKASNENVKSVITLKNGKKITTKKEMSLVLLSFEKEEMLRKKRLAEIRKQKEEEKRKKAEEKNNNGTSGIVGTKSSKFPTLEEQMRAFQNGGAMPDLAQMNAMGMNGFISQDGNKTSSYVNEESYYGTLCRGNRCYLLGEHKVYKKGDKVGNRKITKITSDYVIFDGKNKEWFTR